jgi:hypothetical protein
MTVSLLAFLMAANAFAIGTPQDVKYTEEVKNKYEKLEGVRKSGLGKNATSGEAEALANLNFVERAHNTYRKFGSRLRVPGFISASAVAPLARVVGPKKLEAEFRIGDTLYLRWQSVPLPRPGDRFSIFPPAIVLQNIDQATDFEITAPVGPKESLPNGYRMAGYLYEMQGRLRVVRMNGNLVEGVIEQQKGIITMGSEVIPQLPLLQSVEPINGGIQLSAAVVCGSPHDRLSTTSRSFIYLNRGGRDGIKVGQIFESIETVKLDEAAGGAAPEMSSGEAMVVYTSDSYSTAMITHQFDVIRMGSLLRTKQQGIAVTRVTPFGGFTENKKENLPDEKSPEIPSIENLPEDTLPGSGKNALPEPVPDLAKQKTKPSTPRLSELDELEKSLSLKALSAEEKSRLDKLGRQEKLGAVKPGEDTGAPESELGAPKVENSFKDGKKAAKTDKKSKKKASKVDEEELNLLMMQN